MRPREVFEMQAVHARCAAGVTHAVRRGTIACGAPNAPQRAAWVTTRDPIDCMTCLSRGLESDTHMAVIPHGPIPW